MNWFIYQPLATPPQGFSEPIANFVSWHLPLAEPVRTRAILVSLQAPYLALAQAEFGETITPDKWFSHLAEPVREKLGLRAANQEAYWAEPFGLTQPEAVSIDKWLLPLAEPIRLRPGLNFSLQDELSLFPTPIVSFGWNEALSEPVRTPRRLHSALNPALSYKDYLISDVPPRDWLQPMAEPLRQKIGLGPALQRVYTISPDAMVDHETISMDKWSYSWSEPKLRTYRISTSLGVSRAPQRSELE